MHGERAPVPTGYMAKWIPQLVWVFKEKYFLLLLRIKPWFLSNVKRVFQKVNHEMLHSFFWVFPRHLNFKCRYFGTPFLFDLHKSLKKNNWDESTRLFIQVKVWLKRRLGQLEGGGKQPLVDACSERRRWGRNGPVWERGRGAIRW